MQRVLRGFRIPLSPLQSPQPPTGCSFAARLLRNMKEYVKAFVVDTGSLFFRFTPFRLAERKLSEPAWKSLKIGFFCVVAFDIPAYYQKLPPWKILILKNWGSKNFRISWFLYRTRQKRREYADIPEAFNAVISEISNSKTSSDYSVPAIRLVFAL